MSQNPEFGFVNDFYLAFAVKNQDQNFVLKKKKSNTRIFRGTLMHNKDRSVEKDNEIQGLLGQSTATNSFKTHQKRNSGFGTINRKNNGANPSSTSQSRFKMDRSSPPQNDFGSLSNTNRGFVNTNKHFTMYQFNGVNSNLQNSGTNSPGANTFYPGNSSNENRGNEKLPSSFGPNEFSNRNPDKFQSGFGLNNQNVQNNS